MPGKIKEHSEPDKAESGNLSFKKDQTSKILKSDAGERVFQASPGICPVKTDSSSAGGRFLVRLK